MTSLSLDARWVTDKIKDNECESVSKHDDEDLTFRNPLIIQDVFLDALASLGSVMRVTEYFFVRYQINGFQT